MSEQRQGFVDDEEVIYEHEAGVEGEEEIETQDVETSENVESEASDTHESEDTDETEERDWEAEAVKLGWHSSGAKSAEQFVRDGEEYGLGLKRQIEVLREENRRELEATRQMAEMALKRQREQIEASYNAQIRDAVEVGDVDTFDRLNKSKDAALDGFKQPEPQQQAQHIEPDMLAWKARTNFDKWSPSEQQYAASELQALIDANPNVPQSTFIPALDEKLKRVFPERMGIAPRRQPRRIADTGGTRRQGVKRQNVLNAEERKAAQMMVDQGVYKDEAEYAADYFKHKNGG